MSVENPMKPHIPLFLAMYFVVFISGVAVLSTGAILPDIINEFNISYGMAGLLLSLQAGGNMSAVIVSGLLLDYIGKRAVLTAGSFMVAIGFIGIALDSSGAALFIFIFITGCGWGVSNIVSGIMNDITDGSAKYLNRLHIFFAAGAFIAPFAVIFINSLGLGWRFICGAIGVMAVIAVFILLFVKIPVTQKAQKADKGIHSSFKAFTHARYYVFVLIAFTYTAVETVMNGWITTYFQGTGILTGMEARMLLSLIWISIMVGRITVSSIGDKVKKEHIIITSAIAILVFTVLLIQLHSFISIAVCVFALGLALSALLPTNIANAAAYVKGAGLAMGILLSAGGMGATVGPVVTGMIAARFSLSASMWAAVGFALVLLLGAVINLMFGRALGKAKN